MRLRRGSRRSSGARRSALGLWLGCAALWWASAGLVTRAAARSSTKPKAAARDRWQQQAAADSEARRGGGCADADEYVRSAMGGRDCAAVAAAGDCEMIRALGEPNLVCACSCLPRDRASLPPTSILGGTGFIMRDLKTLLRGVAAKACLIGPQMMRQTEGKQGYDALEECDHLDEKDFENVPHYLSPKLPQVRPLSLCESRRLITLLSAGRF